MTKAELTKKMAEAAKISTVQAENALAAAMKEIVDNDRVALKGFGAFEWRKKPARPARTGRNPRTGEPLEIAATPESTTLHFKPSSSLKEL